MKQIFIDQLNELQELDKKLMGGGYAPIALLHLIENVGFLQKSILLAHPEVDVTISYFKGAGSITYFDLLPLLDDELTGNQ
jgi:hypothetical protein